MNLENAFLNIKRSFTKCIILYEWTIDRNSLLIYMRNTKELVYDEYIKKTFFSGFRLQCPNIPNTSTHCNIDCDPCSYWLWKAVFKGNWDLWINCVNAYFCGKLEVNNYYWFIEFKSINHNPNHSVWYSCLSLLNLMSFNILQTYFLWLFIVWLL